MSSPKRPTHLFGWTPPADRTKQQRDLHEDILAAMPAFQIPGYREEKGRHALWQFGRQVNGGKHLPYNWQLTGSCVGAGAGNMLKTLICVEVVNGEPEEFLHVWWPYHYGQGRRHAGMSGRGEGSFGSAQAKALVQDGVFAITEATEQKLPDFRDVDGWQQLTRSVELEWSDGRAKNVDPWKTLGLRHPVKTAAPIRTTDELKAALQNGYPCTIAGTFGTKTIRPQGTPAVNVAEWDDTWPHQQWIDEAWDHPTLGTIYRWGNNWGPKAHPSPTQDEPFGGFYLVEKTMAKVLSSRGAECYAFSAFLGFPSRNLDWLI